VNLARLSTVQLGRLFDRWMATQAFESRLLMNTIQLS
jgi:hypothetical protein